MKLNWRVKTIDDYCSGIWSAIELDEDGGEDSKGRVLTRGNKTPCGMDGAQITFTLYAIA